MQISTSNLCFVPLDLRSPWVNCCVDGVLCGHIVLKRLMLQRPGKQLHELMRLFLVYQPALQTTRWRYNGDTKWRQRGCHQIFKVDKFSFTILSRIFSWVQKLSRRSRHCLAKRNRWPREHFHQLLAILTPICWASWSGAAASDQNFPEGQAIAQQLWWTGGALEDLVAQMTGSTCCTWREVTPMLPLSDNQRPIRLDKIHNLKLTARELGES